MVPQSEIYSSQERIKSVETKTSRVVLYNPSSHGLTTGELTEDDRQFHSSLHRLMLIPQKNLALRCSFLGGGTPWIST